jgi:hypothetical protein
VHRPATPVKQTAVTVSRRQVFRSLLDQGVSHARAFAFERRT